MKKYSILLALFSLISVKVNAQENLVVNQSFRHCEEDSPLIKALEVAREKCTEITGYTGAKLSGVPVVKTRILSWGYAGCSMIMSSFVKAKYECRN